MSTANPKKLPAKTPLPGLEMQLISILRESSVSELMKTDSEELKLLLAEISTEVNMARAISAPKIFQLKQSLGESIKDLIMAFKEAKLSGRKFYNMLTVTMIFEILNDYFLLKSHYIEARHKQFKDVESNNEVQWLKAVPQAMRQKYLCSIPNRHINRETLRLKATIQKYYNKSRQKS
jgi:hypothetical protein